MDLLKGRNAPVKITLDNLNDVMRIDHVIRVNEDGSVSEPFDVYGPESVHVEREGGEPAVEGPWTLLSGWSLQCMYRGPEMHDSEGIHRPMAEHILETPGYYVATPVMYLGTGSTECQECDADSGEWCEADCEGLEDREYLLEGWVVAHKELEEGK